MLNERSKYGIPHPVETVCPLPLNSMAALPRILTVDPNGDAARFVRAALDLAERPVILVDVPTASDAWEELSRGDYTMVVAALVLDNGINGVDLALRTHQKLPETALILFGEQDEVSQLNEDSLQGAPFLLFQRPFDPQQFLRVIQAGLDGQDIFTAYPAPVLKIAGNVQDLGPTPNVDMKVAQQFIDSLLTDVGAKTILLISRTGEVLLERGAFGYLNREQLAASLSPTVHTIMDMAKVVGGAQVSALQYFDGETYDVFVLSVGFHHFMCLAFDGNAGNRYFGAVNRFGRRTAEDLITLIGNSAFTFQAAVVEEKPRRRKTRTMEIQAVVVEPEPLIRAEKWDEPTPPAPEPEPIRLDPILNFDASIFDGMQFDSSLADELFDPEKMAELANETRRDRGPLSYDEARELGIIP